jgi:hypothetical protein
MPACLFVTCALFAAGAVPAARNGSALLGAMALVGVFMALGGLVAWVLHADRTAALRERLADPIHVSNWWPDFERQFWRYLDDRLGDERA